MKKKLLSFRKLDVMKKSTLGNGYSVKALRIGLIELNMRVSNRKQQRCKLYETLYAMKILYHLPSVLKAMKSRKTFVFIKSYCQVLDEKGKIIATSIKIGNLYHLNYAEKQQAAHAVAKSSSNDAKKRFRIDILLILEQRICRN